MEDSTNSDKDNPFTNIGFRNIIIEDITRLEKLFELNEKRIDSVEKRIDSVEKRLKIIFSIDQELLRQWILRMLKEQAEKRREIDNI